MKIVLNRCFGGFSLSDWAAAQLGVNPYDDLDRTDWNLIQLVENYPDRVSGPSAHLIVIELPEETTDWVVNDYDGAETVYYCVNGKIHTK